MKKIINKNTRLLIALFCIICLVFSSCITFVSAEETVDKGKWGNNITWKLKPNGTLVLSGSGEMKEGIVRYDDENPDDIKNQLEIYPWVQYMPDIKKIVIAEGITKISNRAFQMNHWDIDNRYWTYAKLTTVNLPSTLKEIGDGAFYGCNKLKTINFPEGLKKIGRLAFGGCKNLKEAILPSSVKEIKDNTFYYCKNLINVEIPGVTKIGKDSFSLCEDLTYIKLSKKLTVIKARAFKGCKKLTSITIPSTIEKIEDEAFRDCTGLEKATIKSNLKKEIRLGEMIFYDCSSLKEIKLPSKTTKLVSTFSGCSSLKKITIPKSVEKIDGELFYGCENLKKIVIRTTKLDLTETKQKDTLFKGIPKNATIILPNEKYHKYRKFIEPFVSESVKFKNADGKSPKLKSRFIVESGKWGNNIQWQIDKDGCLTLFGKGEVEEGTNGYYPTPLLNKERYPWIQYAEIIKKIIVKTGITNIPDYAFSSYVWSGTGEKSGAKFTNLITVKLGSTIKTIGEGAFLKCKSLKNINLPKKLTEIEEYSFNGCNGLKTIFLPDSLKEIGKNAFKYCKNLTKITIPKNIENIEYRVFYDCINLKSIKFKTTKWDSTEGKEQFKGINPNATFKIPSARFKSYKKAISKYAPKSVKYEKY